MTDFVNYTLKNPICGQKRRFFSAFSRVIAVNATEVFAFVTAMFSLQLNDAFYRMQLLEAQIELG